MRIAVDLRPLLEPYESGVTVYTKSMVFALQKLKDLDLDLYYQSRERCERIHELFPEVRHLKISNSFFHFRSLFRFPNLPSSYFERDPDLIWIPDRRPFYRTDISLVMTVHDSVPEICSSSLSLKSKLWHKIFSLNRLLSLCSGVLLPSLCSGAGLPRTLKKEVTYEGADLTKEMHEPSKVKTLLRQPFFLSISPADPRKGLNKIVELAKEFPKLNFALVGLKKDDKRFSSLKLDELKNLFVYGEVSEEEKLWFLKKAKALLALSSYEGFDLPVLEAVRAKTPVIMSDIAVHRELYERAVFVKDEAGLIAAVHDFSKNKASLPKPKGDYTWENAAKRASLFFGRVIGDKD